MRTRVNRDARSMGFSVRNRGRAVWLIQISAYGQKRLRGWPLWKPAQKTRLPSPITLIGHGYCAHKNTERVDRHCVDYFGFFNTTFCICAYWEISFNHRELNRAYSIMIVMLHVDINWLWNIKVSSVKFSISRRTLRHQSLPILSSCALFRVDSTIRKCRKDGGGVGIRCRGEEESENISKKWMYPLNEVRILCCREFVRHCCPRRQCSSCYQRDVPTWYFLWWYKKIIIFN